MTTSTLRALLSGAMIVGLSAGCAHTNAPQTGGAPSPSQTRAEATTVSEDDAARAPGDPIEKLLMSRSPGVWVGRSASGGLTIRVRGSTSFSGSTEPLYLVDGVPFPVGSDGSLSGVNPYDIASIKVLKDAADLTMYGVRGANGVIIIKTKRHDDR